MCCFVAAVAVVDATDALIYTAVDVDVVVFPAAVAVVDVAVAADAPSHSFYYFFPVRILLQSRPGQR